MKICKSCGKQYDDDWKDNCQSCNSNSYTIICNNCRHALRDEDAFCGNCGTKAGAHGIKCPVCNTEFFTSACPTCGYSLQKESIAKQQKAVEPIGMNKEYSSSLEGKTKAEQLGLGIQHLELGNYAYAKEVFNSVMKNSPNEYKGWLGLYLSEVNIRQGNLTHSYDELVINTYVNNIRKLAPADVLDALGNMEVQIDLSQSIKTMNELVNDCKILEEKNCSNNANEFAKLRMRYFKKSLKCLFKGILKGIECTLLLALVLIIPLLSISAESGSGNTPGKWLRVFVIVVFLFSPFFWIKYFVKSDYRKEKRMIKNKYKEQEEKDKEQLKKWRERIASISQVVEENKKKKPMNYYIEILKR